MLIIYELNILGGDKIKKTLEKYWNNGIKILYYWKQLQNQFAVTFHYTGGKRVPINAMYVWLAGRSHQV